MQKRPAKKIATKPKRILKKSVPQRKESAITKQIWKPGTMLFPLPVVMVTSQDAEKRRTNICTVAWTGTVCTDPPMLSISLRKERHSHALISESREFVVNVPSVQQVRMTDYCGVVSGRDVDKFKETGLTAVPASKVKTFLILECPVNLECRVKKTLELGSHTMFVAEVLAVQVNENLLNSSGRLALEKAGLATFIHGSYYSIGKKLGFFGYSIQKKKTRK